MIAFRPRFVFFALVSILCGMLVSPIAAQEATPGLTEEAAEPEFHYLTGLALEELPYTPSVINIMGATFAPGSMTPSGGDSFAVFIYVESGTITLLADNAVTIYADGLAGQGVPAEQANPGQPAEVQAGEAFLVLPDVPYEISNEAAESAEVLFLLLLPPDEGDSIPVASPLS